MAYKSASNCLRDSDSWFYLSKMVLDYNSCLLRNICSWPEDVVKVVYKKSVKISSSFIYGLTWNKTWCLSSWTGAFPRPVNLILLWTWGWINHLSKISMCLGHEKKKGHRWNFPYSDLSCSIQCTWTKLYKRPPTKYIHTHTHTHTHVYIFFFSKKKIAVLGGPFRKHLGPHVAHYLSKNHFQKKYKKAFYFA